MVKKRTTANGLGLEEIMVYFFMFVALFGVFILAAIIDILGPFGRLATCQQAGGNRVESHYADDVGTWHCSNTETGQSISIPGW